MKKALLVLLFFLGLVYVASPGPSSIDDFSPLPDSLKSDEPGDTTQVPNIAAYFSQYDRAGITKFYKEKYAGKHWFGFIPPIELNYPPRAAYTYVRDLQMGTFLEEYVYPLRGSLFVNGYEPYVENEMGGYKHGLIGDYIHIDGTFYRSKTTIRTYPNGWYIRLIVYIGIWLSSIALYKLSKKAIL